MKANKKSVIITLLVTRVEIQCTSITSAATEMGVSYQSISRLVNKRAKKSKGKGGDYSGQFFTARFRDE
jgi:molybdenum-dependent DNA-binding transcriptional regulator ModE